MNTVCSLEPITRSIPPKLNLPWRLHSVCIILTNEITLLPPPVIATLASLNLKLLSRLRNPKLAKLAGKASLSLSYAALTPSNKAGMPAWPRPAPSAPPPPSTTCAKISMTMRHVRLFQNQATADAQDSALHGPQSASRCQQAPLKDMQGLHGRAPHLLERVLKRQYPHIDGLKA